MSNGAAVGKKKSHGLLEYLYATSMIVDDTQGKKIMKDKHYKTQKKERKERSG